MTVELVLYVAASVNVLQNAGGFILSDGLVHGKRSINLGNCDTAGPHRPTLAVLAQARIMPWGTVQEQREPNSETCHKEADRDCQNRDRGSCSQ